MDHPKKRKVYISGRITGLPFEVFTENFTRAQVLMEKMGFEVLNPLEVVACKEENCNFDNRLPDGRYHHSWQCYMKHDIIMLLEADEIAMLPDWKESEGAQFERLVALKIDMICNYITDNYQQVY